MTPLAARPVGSAVCGPRPASPRSSGHPGWEGRGPETKPGPSHALFPTVCPICRNRPAPAGRGKDPGLPACPHTWSECATA